MAEALGSLLRITLDHRSKQVPLQKELELIQYYITIQEIPVRGSSEFPDGYPAKPVKLLRFKADLTASGGKCHPLWPGRKYGRLSDLHFCRSLSGKGSIDHLCKNDGSAFEDDLLSKLENRQIEPHGFGIGLLNIQKRMQITYGEAYGLTLYNEEELAVAKAWYIH